MKKKSYVGRFILLAAVAATLFLLYKTGVTDYLTINNLKHYTTSMQQAVYDHYLLSVLVFIIALIFATTISIPFIVVMPIGGLLFGLIPGTIYALIAGCISGMIAFLLSRYLIGDFFQERWGARLKKFNDEFHANGYLYLLGFHFFPVTPFFIFNVLCGLTQVPLVTFLWTTAVGIAPSIFIYNYIGYQLTEITEFKDLISKELIYALLALKALSIVTIIIGRFGKKIKTFFAR